MRGVRGPDAIGLNVVISGAEAVESVPRVQFCHGVAPGYPAAAPALEAGGRLRGGHRACGIAVLNGRAVLIPDKRRSAAFLSNYGAVGVAGADGAGIFISKTRRALLRSDASLDIALLHDAAAVFVHQARRVCVHRGHIAGDGAVGDGAAVYRQRQARLIPAAADIHPRQAEIGQVARVFIEQGHCQAVDGVSVAVVRGAAAIVVQPSDLSRLAGRNDNVMGLEECPRSRSALGPF